MGELVTQEARQHVSTIRAVLVESSRNPALNEVMQHQLFDQRKPLMNDILQQAVERSEIAGGAINDELWDLLPGYLIFRCLMANRPPTQHTVQALVDDLIIRGLARPGR